MSPSAAASAVAKSAATSAVAKSASSLLQRSIKKSHSNSKNNNNPIKNVFILGGTHGNEYTGVWVIKSLQSKSNVVTTASPTTTSTTTTRLETLQNELYPSLNLSTLLANPQAHLENKRFIHEDLNRQFTKDALSGGNVEETLRQMDEEGDGLPRSVESLRAREINLLLGPKFITTTGERGTGEGTGTGENEIEDKQVNANEDTSADVVIDLHTTTSNMGIVLIVAEGDPIMTRAAAYVMFQLNKSNSDSKDGSSGDSADDGDGGGDGDDDDVDTVRCLLHTHPNRDTRPNVASTARHGFTIEVGPVPQGVLRHDVVEKTEKALFAMLEYLELNNSDEGRLKLDSILKAAYSSDACANADGNGEVTCFKSAKAKKRGEMSGKISWPTCEDNPNFPALMVHKHLQDRDFELIHKGDPLFVDLHGNTIPYDGSHGSPVYLMFVNEGGYYYKSSGSGIAVATKAYFDLETGLLVREEVQDGNGIGDNDGDGDGDDR